MARHRGENLKSHRREGAPRASFLRSPALLFTVGLVSLGFVANNTREVAANAATDVYNQHIKPFLIEKTADEPCAPSDPDKIAEWQAKVRSALNSPLEQREPYSVDLSQRLAKKHGVRQVDAGESRNQIAAAPDPATAIAAANKYTSESFSIITTSGALNENTANESLALVNKLSSMSADYIVASDVRHIIIQSSAPLQNEPPAQAFIHRGEDSNTIELAAQGAYKDIIISPIDDSLIHEFDHGFQSQYSWFKCHSRRPSGDFDIEAANPPGFSYNENTERIGWQGVTISKKGAEGPDEDTATIAAWIQFPEQIPNWDHLRADPVVDKIGVLCMRYEKYVPGMGRWIIDMVSSTESLSRVAGGINTTSMLPNN